jgi:hypothetical protein
MAKISAHKIKRYGDNGSPCLQPRPIWKNYERLPPIGDNIRLIYDMLQLTEENNIPGLLLLIDFEKAFDSIS